MDYHLVWGVAGIDPPALVEVLVAILPAEQEPEWNV